MMMLQLQALFKNSDNCLLTVSGNGTNPRYWHALARKLLKTTGVLRLMLALSGP